MIRKIIPFIEAFGEDFKLEMQNKVLSLCASKLKEFDNLNNIDAENIVDETNDLIVIEFAETISRLILIANESIDENALYSILNS